MESVDKGVTETKVYTYVYDNEDIIIEHLDRTTDGVNAPTETTRFVHGPGIDEPIAMERGGSVYYYHADGPGSIIKLTDGAGAVVQERGF